MRGRDVLLIRGAPGVGKSTLGRSLHRALSAGAVVEIDDVRSMIAQVDWSSRAHHDTALTAALAAVDGFLRAGARPAVLIDTFSRSRLNTVQAELERAMRSHHTLSLWVEPEILRKRLEARTSGFKEWEPARVLNEEVHGSRYSRETLVDVTGLGHDEILALALAAVMDASPEVPP